MKVAIIHDWLVNFTGSERVLKQLTKAYPKAPIFTTVYNAQAAPQFGNEVINTSYLQNIPGAVKNYPYFFPLMPAVFESFDLSEYDLVISNTSDAAKGVITSPTTCHISYCHTPTRYLWEPWLDTRATTGAFKSLRRMIVSYLRVWDLQAAQRPDFIMANSNNIARKIKQYYHRSSGVLYPPVDAKFFELAQQPKQDFFLLVSRLAGHKKVDLAVKAFIELRQPLKIVGEGPEKKRLEKLAKDHPQIEFLGFQPDNVVRDLYQQAKAFIFPQEEDFGITPLEAMACGTPVIAYGKGGALETVVSKETGLFFSQSTTQSLVSAVREFKSEQFDKQKVRDRALEFDQPVFQKDLKQMVEKYYQRFQQKHNLK